MSVYWQAVAFCSQESPSKRRKVMSAENEMKETENTIENSVENDKEDTVMEDVSVHQQPSPIGIESSGMWAASPLPERSPSPSMMMISPSVARKPGMPASSTAITPPRRSKSATPPIVTTSPFSPATEARKQRTIPRSRRSTRRRKQKENTDENPNELSPPLSSADEDDADDNPVAENKETDDQDQQSDDEDGDVSILSPPIDYGAVIASAGLAGKRV